VTDINPFRLDLARTMGATLAVNANQMPLGEVQKRLGMKEGFDVGLEMSGNAHALRDMIANMSHGGKIAILGIPPKRCRWTGGRLSLICSRPKHLWP
jgi:threonine 3-dehydrogenase